MSLWYRVVRLSSPTLNFFIAVGAFMMYASIFFYLLPTDSEKIAKFHCVVSLDFLLKIPAMWFILFELLRLSTGYSLLDMP